LLGFIERFEWESDGMDIGLQSRPYTAWQLIKVYWQSRERTFAYLSLIFALVMTVVLVGMDVVFNKWYNYFYDALQDYDKRGAIDLLIVFMFIAAVYIVIAVYRYYVQAYLGLRWRRWMTNQFLNRWLEKRSYYYLENFDELTDNPDQRIQEDIGALVTSSLDLTIGMVSSITTIFAFIYILWTLSGHISIPLGQYGSLEIPGYLVWVAIIYALIGTHFTFKIGRPLVSLNFEQQRREANFRFAAIDLRSHAEHVALYRGEHHEKIVLSQLVDKFLDNWYMIILRQKLLLWFTAGYNQVSVMLPLLVALPNYFGKVFKLGGLIQTLQAFGRIQDALSFIVNSYTRIAEWQAVVRRLLTFVNHMYTVERHAIDQNHFVYREQPENKILVKNLNIYTPNNEKLLINVNAEFIHGEHYLIKGPSGVGKSTLVRVIAGIWPYGSGEIVFPEKKNIMYLPQKPYMPIGTLEEALLFPDDIGSLPESTLVQLLQEVHLPELVNELNHATMWSEHLSPGELQRVAFIRVLIHKPDWVFLDETTSALDLESERFLYTLLKTKLPNCSIISVGHRPSLESFHTHQIDLSDFSVARELAE
jgi:putative ATP-binding cassette transporter